MTENIAKLRATLDELKQELHSLDTLDHDTRNGLEDMMREIEAALHQPKGGKLEHHTMAQRLQEAAQSFEESHPTLSRIVGNIVDGLGQMGI
jgi:chromosome segregation ATPase